MANNCRGYFFLPHTVLYTAVLRYYRLQTDIVSYRPRESVSDIFYRALHENGFCDFLPLIELQDQSRKTDLLRAAY